MTRITINSDEAYPVFVLETGKDATYGAFLAPAELVDAVRQAEADLAQAERALCEWAAENAPTDEARSEARSWLV